MPISVGNDLVWLEDPQNKGRYADLLLVRRVLTPKERLLVQVSADPDRMLWSLWAAKEAAFKVFCRDVSGTVFSPSRFEVDPGRPGTPASVAFGGRALGVAWLQGPDWVHALAAADPASCFAVVEPWEGGDESRAVRDLALRVLREAGFAPGTITGRPPVYRTADGDIPVSLSHDGPYAAVAFPRRN